MPVKNRVHTITFGRLLDKQVAKWNGFNAPKAMSERTANRIRLQRLSVALPRRPDEHIGSYCTRLSKWIDMTPAQIDLWLYGALYRKDV